MCLSYQVFFCNVFCNSLSLFHCCVWFLGSYGNSFPHSNLYLIHAIHWCQVHLLKILLLSLPKLKIKSIFSTFHKYSPILSLVFQYLLSGSNALFQSTLLFACTNPLIQPVHLNSPLVLLFTLIPFPRIPSPVFSPHLSSTSFLEDIPQISFLPEWNLSLQLQQCSGSSSMGTLATIHLVTECEPLPFVDGEATVCHKTAQLYSKLPRLPSVTQVTDLKSVCHQMPGERKFVYQCHHWIVAFLYSQQCLHGPHHWTISNFSLVLQFFLENGVQLCISAHFSVTPESCWAFINLFSCSPVCWETHSQQTSLTDEVSCI